VRRRLPVDAGRSREAFAAWLEDALAGAAAGVEVPFAVVDARSGAPIGSTRYLMLRPEHRGLEIGWTWMARERWGTGANVEAKCEVRDSAWYAIVDDDWPEVRANLERRLAARRRRP